MTTLRGCVPVPGGARRAHFREWRRESLWLWPAVAVIAACVAGDVASRYVHSFTFHEGLFPTNLDDARTLLATIAAALLTFTGVVFSITLVALQMSSTQYSPRVLRTFVRKPVTKLALATFIATFVYSLTLLARVGTTTAAHTVPQGAVGLAYLLVLASVIIFVVFVNSTVRSMRVSYVIQAVFNETTAGHRRVVRAGLRLSRGARASLRADSPRDLLRSSGRGDRRRRRPSSRRARTPAWVRAAAVRARGDVHGARLRAGGGARRDDARDQRQVIGAVDCFAVRTLYQDPCYGVRQLVDIAIRAVSPAINDPTTAVQVLDRLHGVLRAIADLPGSVGRLPRQFGFRPPGPTRCRIGTRSSTWRSPRSASTARAIHRSHES